MAEAIAFNPGNRKVKQEYYRRLHAAPEEHVEALLDIYTILQLMHDKGLLEIFKDALGSGEKILEIFADTMEREEVVCTIRNMVILVKVIGSIEPETLENLMAVVSKSSRGSNVKDPPGLLRLLGKFSSKNSRRALAPLAEALEATGRNIPQTKNPPRKKITRHSA